MIGDLAMHRFVKEKGWYVIKTCLHAHVATIILHVFCNFVFTQLLSLLFYRVKVFEALIAMLVNRPIRRLKYATPYELYFRRKNPVDVFAALRRVRPGEFDFLSSDEVKSKVVNYLAHHAHECAHA